MQRRFRGDMLQVGALGLAGIGLGGLGLPDLLLLAGPSSNRVPRRPKSVIVILLPGGPSHVDLWDMKPEASS